MLIVEEIKRLKVHESILRIEADGIFDTKTGRLVGYSGGKDIGKTIIVTSIENNGSFYYWELTEYQKHFNIESSHEGETT